MDTIPVLHVIHAFSDNSMNRITGQIVQRLRPQGFEFHIGAVVYEEPLQGFFRDLGATVIEFAQTGEGPLRARVAEYIQQHGVKLVHSHSARTAIIAGLALGPGRRGRHIYTKHLLLSPGDRRNGWVYWALDRLSLYLPGYVVPVSKVMGERLKRVPGLRRSRIIPIQNGVDTERFYAPDECAAVRAELGLPNDSVVIGFAGRIELMKRLDLLLDAFARLRPQFPALRLLLVGRGSELESLQAHAARLNVADAVVWAGFRTDMPRLLAAMDIYAQPSSNEGLSLSILEAMAAGKAIVTTDVGGAREIVQDRVTGLIVPPEDSAVFEEALRWVLGDGGTRIISLGEAARRFVNAEFSATGMVDAYGRLYRTCLETTAR
jgi:glycosyltransferase involved in cell wall biosynthesis